MDKQLYENYKVAIKNRIVAGAEVISAVKDNTVVSESVDYIVIKNTSNKEKYVLALACNMDRCECEELNRELYQLSWLKHTKLAKKYVPDLLHGLDNLVCDTLGILSAVEDNNYEPTDEFDVLLEENTIEEIHDIAIALFEVLNNY